MGIAKKLTFLIFINCISISVKHQKAEAKKWPWKMMTHSSSTFFSPPYPPSSGSVFLSVETENAQEEFEVERGGSASSVGWLEYDFYRDSCPQAKNAIRESVRTLYEHRSRVARAFLRLAFHDCFIEGGGASILLDATEDIDSENDVPPNNGLTGFDIIDIIKSEIEETCPGVVSCADIVVLAAREGVVQADGPFYPLSTGDIATYELPSPHSDLPETLATYASKGFDERKTVSLLGCHRIGVVPCKLFKGCLYNFGGTNKPVPSIDAIFLHEMILRCNNEKAEAAPAFHASQLLTSAPLPSFQASPASPSAPTASFEDPKSSTSPLPSFDRPPSSSSDVPSSAGKPLSKGYKYPLLSSSGAPSSSFQGYLVSAQGYTGIEMAYKAPGIGFGTVYWSLLQNRGILYSDQLLIAEEETKTWIKAYGSNAAFFLREFALATGSMGQVNRSCEPPQNSKIVSAHLGSIDGDNEGWEQDGREKAGDTEGKGDNGEEDKDDDTDDGEKASEEENNGDDDSEDDNNDDMSDDGEKEHEEDDGDNGDDGDQMGDGDDSSNSDDTDDIEDEEMNNSDDENETEEEDDDDEGEQDVAEEGEEEEISEIDAEEFARAYMRCRDLINDYCIAVYIPPNEDEDCVGLYYIPPNRDSTDDEMDGANFDHDGAGEESGDDRDNEMDDSGHDSGDYEDETDESDDTEWASDDDEEDELFEGEEEEVMFEIDEDDFIGVIVRVGGLIYGGHKGIYDINRRKAAQSPAALFWEIHVAWAYFMGNQVNEDVELDELWPGFSIHYMHLDWETDRYEILDDDIEYITLHFVSFMRLLDEVHVIPLDH